MKKSLVKIMIAITVLLSTTINAQTKNTKTEEIKVSGNCGMCKKTIEKAGNINDIATVVWNKETKIATVTYDESKTNKEEIAKDEDYDNLPGCCQYNRE